MEEMAAIMVGAAVAAGHRKDLTLAQVAMERMALLL
jgi:hypothetical protein